MTPDKTAPQTLGTTVTFTATATDGTAPYQFKWWLNTDGGPVWTPLQDWSTSNTLMWTPTVANSAYQIATWQQVHELCHRPVTLATVIVDKSANRAGS